MSLQEFTSRTLWISVWSESSLGQNDFLGEVHVSLSSCKIDELEEHTLLPRAPEEDVIYLFIKFNMMLFFLFT